MDKIDIFMMCFLAVLAASLLNVIITLIMNSVTGGHVQSGL